MLCWSCHQLQRQCQACLGLATICLHSRLRQGSLRSADLLGSESVRQSLRPPPTLPTLRTNSLVQIYDSSWDRLDTLITLVSILVAGALCVPRHGESFGDLPVAERCSKETTWALVAGVSNVVVDFFIIY